MGSSHLFFWAGAKSMGVRGAAPTKESRQFMRHGRFTDGYEADYVHTGSSQPAATSGLHDCFGAPTDILLLYPPNYSPEPSDSPKAPLNSLTVVMHTDGALYTPTLVDCLVCSWTVLGPTQRITIRLAAVSIRHPPRAIAQTRLRYQSPVCTLWSRVDVSLTAQTV